ncbi:MAG: hypothetical protein OP8BY_1866 [Candidatus Saccharicenans subterraneus]|uniref:Uncharacterized protein n=1 Tax=Candidatus Saccharicenans subterraneus TaxID=2508984 RepID=A0A3E2BNN2_9BACT|nr:MAG: hypothetical protein OP8BY_1866 [Candidatus Saccharicenans subterraneum]
MGLRPGNRESRIERLSWPAGGWRRGGKILFPGVRAMAAEKDLFEEIEA